MKTFKELDLSEELLLALEDLKFSKPTETQVATLELGLEGKDLTVCAPTGSGKTAAFGIPLIQSLIANPGTTGLILAPTRELAQQISDFLRELLTHRPDFKVCSIVGGADIRKQLTKLKKKPQIIVATPGRLIDHIKRKSVNLKTTACLVLDEGDRMLDMGFAPQLDQILKNVPKKRQSLLFSATMPARVKKLAEKYLYKPQAIVVGEKSMPVKSVKQSVIQVDGKKKFDLIVDQLNQRKGSVVVFVKTKRRTDQLSKTLKSFGFKVSAVHGDKSQGQRNRALNQFRDGKTRILCATDVAARGLDVPSVEHVINFDLPMMDEDYVHRIGRTARNGAEGEAVSFVGVNDELMWLKITKKYNIKGVEIKTSATARTNTNKKKSKKKKFGAKRPFKVSNSKSEGQFKKKKRNKLRNAPKKKRSTRSRTSSR